MEKLYNELADWWPLMSSPADYAEEASWFARVLCDSIDPVPQNVLELGSGGGNNASHLKKHFAMILVDRSPGMLAVSERLNPDCNHVEGDMRSVRLDREFDAVFIHDAVMYITSEPDLRKVIQTAHLHCRAGGAALLAPDWVTETFTPGADHGGHDNAARSMRYVAWTHPPARPDDTTFVVDFAYILRSPDGSTRVEQDRHVHGLFPRATWLRILSEVGFHPRSLTDPYGRDVFLAFKPQ